MFPKNDEEMGLALVELGRRNKDKFDAEFVLMPEYEEYKKRTNRFGDQFDVKYNAWIKWIKSCPFVPLDGNRIERKG